MNKIKIPTNFQDVTLWQWMRYKKELSPIDKLKLFWEGNISAVSINALQTANDAIDELMDEDPRFFKIITHNGKEYGFINDWDKFTTGEWIDVETYCKDLTLNAHKVMSILYRPIKSRAGDNYEIEPYNGSHEEFKEVPASFFLGMMVFFCESKSKYLTNFQASLMEKVTQMLSRRDGTGTT